MHKLSTIVSSSSKEVASHHVIVDPDIDTQESAGTARSGRVLKNKPLIYKRNSEQVVANYEPPKQENEPMIKEVDDDQKASNGGGYVRDPTVQTPIKITHPFPQRLKKKYDTFKFQKFLGVIKDLSVNIPFVDVLFEMPNMINS
ncbi:hypothetical protein RDI58_001127 [Solanum bulbocastanum]|uniref:Uncharacterized protein n=1 Tax=Solanum bulbocastanum TaxID=147425 RepID=A0AAN8U8Y4_SOLBU